MIDYNSVGCQLLKSCSPYTLILHSTLFTKTTGINYVYVHMYSNTVAEYFILTYLIPSYIAQSE